MEKKPKILILYNKLFHYRIPIWNILAQKCDLTVTYSAGSGNYVDKCNFGVRYLPIRRFKNRFVFQKDDIRNLAKDYDVVIAYGDISWLKFITLPWFNKTKVIFWTLGVSASYDKGFDEKKGWDLIRKFFYNQADALVFYTDYPIKKYAEMGVDSRKMFVAPNTVAVFNDGEIAEKDSLLFIGTLYRQKGLQVLLDSYLNANKKINLPLLNIVGNGPDYDVINKWIVDNKLENKIKLRGAIYDLKEKAKFFKRAFACISPNQAGLSVLESMGYGVPFVTSKKAITGGELFNIHDGKDGVLMDDVSCLTDILTDIAENKEKYVKMGEKAKAFYYENRTPEHMADGLWKAVSYVLQK